MKRKMRRWLSILMTVLMVCGMLPMQAFAMRVQHNITAMNGGQQGGGGTGQSTDFSPYLIFDKNCNDSVGNMPSWIDVDFPDGQNASKWTSANVKIPAVRVTRADYVFMGWSETKTGEATYGVYDKTAKKITDLVVPVNNEKPVKTLYAVWMEKSEFERLYGLDARLKQNEPGINKTVNGKNFALASPGDALSFTLESTLPDNLAGYLKEDGLVAPQPSISGKDGPQGVLSLLQSSNDPSLQNEEDDPENKSNQPAPASNEEDNGGTPEGDKTAATRQEYELVFHDKMSAGLVLDQDSIQVTIGNKPIDRKDYQLVIGGEQDDCTFHVTLDLVDLYYKYGYSLNDVNIVNKIQVTYKAEYTGEVGTDDDGHKATNTAWVTYPGSGPDTPKSEVEVANGKLVVKKIDYTTKEVLQGAVFKLYDTGKVMDYESILSQAGQSMLAQANQSNQNVLSLRDGDSAPNTDAAESMIRDTELAVQSRTSEKLSSGHSISRPGQGTAIDQSKLKLLGTVTTDENGLGKFECSLGEGHIYILKEVKAPDGYVGVTQDMVIVLTGENGQFLVTYEVPNVKVAETGGVGTRMFTIIGLAIMAGAGAAFVISRRKRED